MSQGERTFLELLEQLPDSQYALFFLHRQLNLQIATVSRKRDIGASDQVLAYQLLLMQLKVNAQQCTSIIATITSAIQRAEEEIEAEVQYVLSQISQACETLQKATLSYEQLQKVYWEELSKKEGCPEPEAETECPELANRLSYGNIPCKNAFKAYENVSDLFSQLVPILKPLKNSPQKEAFTMINAELRKIPHIVDPEGVIRKVNEINGQLDTAILNLARKETYSWKYRILRFLNKWLGFPRTTYFQTCQNLLRIVVARNLYQAPAGPAQPVAGADIQASGPALTVERVQPPETVIVSADQHHESGHKPNQK